MVYTYEYVYVSGSDVTRKYGYYHKNITLYYLSFSTDYEFPERF